MRLCGLLVLFLGLALLFSVMPQSMRASRASMPTTACAVLASQDKMIPPFLSEEFSAVTEGGTRVRALSTELFSAFLGGAVSAPRLLSSLEDVADLLCQSGNVGIGTTSPSRKLDVYLRRMHQNPYRLSGGAQENAGQLSVHNPCEQQPACYARRAEDRSHRRKTREDRAARVPPSVQALAGNQSSEPWSKPHHD